MKLCLPCRFLFISTLILFLSGQPSSAQHYFDYRKNTYAWGTKKPVSNAIPEQYKNNDAVILDEENVITFGGGEKEENLLIFNQKKTRIKIQTITGKEKYSVISLPESYDPLFDQFSCRNDKAKTSHYPLYWDISLYEFAARIIKPDGKIVKAVFKDNYKEPAILDLHYDPNMWNTNGMVSARYRNTHYYEFVISNLEVGDELEYFYRLEIPYPDNWYHFNYCRIFFNNDLPKVNYSLRIQENKKNTNQFHYANGGEYDTTFEDDKYVYFDWKKQNLPGSFSEQGIKPYQNLPYFIYTLKVQSESYRFLNSSNGANDYMPPWLYILRAREIYDYETRRNATGWIKDKQNILVKEFIDQKTEGLSDSNKYQKIINVHTTIADSFKYQNDDAFYAEEESGLLKFGDNVKEKIMRELGRYIFYSKLLSYLKIDYFTIYPLDNRIGELSKYYFTPIYNIDYLFGPIVKGNVIYTYPKKSDFGYYLDEIPFYWENTKAFLMNYNDLFYELKLEPNIISTPASSLNENIRMANVMVQVNLDSLKADFDAKISLSGQFSTMTRSLYTKNECDSTINSLYRKPIWNLNGNGKLVSNEMTNGDKIFPFKHDFRIKYKCDKIISNSGSDITIDLNGWFNHIIYPGLKSEGRTLKFYPDFVFQDTYRYMIKFNKNIELKEGQQSFEKENDFGKLIITVKRVQDDALLLESFFVVKQGEVDADKVENVKVLYDEIGKLNKSQIKVAVKL